MVQIPMSPRIRGGDDGVRTHDLRLAKPALYQLSYIPDESSFYSSLAGALPTGPSPAKRACFSAIGSQQLTLDVGPVQR